MEFTARGTSALPAQTLIYRPYLDRWYHVAITRYVGEFIGYLDGRVAFSTMVDIGSAFNTSGVFIGAAPDDSAGLDGDVQEVAPYESGLPQEAIAQYTFADQPVAEPSLRGYYKLGAIPNQDLKNHAASPSSATNSATKFGSVTLRRRIARASSPFLIPEKSGGRDAVASLSGGFSWDHTILAATDHGDSP